MTKPPGYSIESVDLQTATNAEIQEIAQFRQDLALEQKPEDPPTPIEVITQWLRARPPGQWRVVFVARDREWSEAAPKGYRLEQIDDTVPEEFVKAYIEASEGINDMPRGDIAFKDWKLTEAQIRQRESFFKQAGLTWWLLLAIDEQTGAGVGFTEVEFNPSDPHAIQQEGTAVVAAHRRRGIGLWLKAVMLGRILAQRPDSHFIRTGNANVNAQMLAINEKLGFTYAWQSTLWQLPMADARKALAGAEAPARA